MSPSSGQTANPKSEKTPRPEDGDTVFVSVAAFCDENLIFTLDSLFSNAKNPARIFVAVVNQTLANQRPELKTKPYYPQIRYLHIDAVDSRGVCWARSLAFSLYRNETWFLQIDSHTWFHSEWDARLIAQLKSLELEFSKPLLSTYPPGFQFDSDHQPEECLRPSESVMVLRVHDETSLLPDNAILRFTTEWVANQPYQSGFHIAGGFLFARGRFIREVPYDPHLYFHGEEQSLSIRAWTKGWDIIHPRMSDIPLRHLYKSKGTRSDGHHWRADLEKERTENYAELTQRARQRLCELVYTPDTNDPYGIGSQRSVEQFALFSGIDYPNCRVWRESPEQRKHLGRSFLHSTLGHQGAHTRHGDMTVFANDRYISRSLHVYGQWAQHEIAQLCKHLKPGDHVIDAGANLGYTSLALAAAVGEEGRVLAFEPHPQIFALLEKNIANNAHHAKVECRQIALGEQAAALRMKPVPTYANQNIGVMRTSTQGSIDVIMCSIDELKVTRCDAIKIDVAGAELAVLEGAKATIRAFRPVILIEFNDAFQQDIVAWFEQMGGYRLEPISAPAFEPDNWRAESTNIFNGIVLHNAIAIPVDTAP